MFKFLKQKQSKKEINRENEILKAEIKEFEKADNTLANLHRSYEELLLTEQEIKNLEDNSDRQLNQRIEYYRRARAKNKETRNLD